MKKIIALAIAILMMAAIAVPAFAGTISSDAGTAGTTVTYAPEGAFSVTIPDSATFAKEEESDDITASIALSAGGVLNMGETLTVTVNSTQTTDSNDEDEIAKDTWNLKNGDVSVAYTIKNGETPVLPGDAVLTYEAGAEDSEATLSLKIVAPATQAATYTDTLTFTVAVTPAA